MQNQLMPIKIQQAQLNSLPNQVGHMPFTSFYR